MTRTILDIAISYFDRGWTPVAIPSGKKGPVRDDWGTLFITRENLSDYFSGSCNIGVQMGERSDGLVDVDLDCLEALCLARHFLPETDAIFGRASKRASHWLYVVAGEVDDDRATIPHKGQRPQLDMLVELRIGAGGKAAQTLFPGSVHPSGEPVEWEKTGEPTTLEFHTIKRAVARLAVACLLLRAYPGPGNRDNYALCVGGVLARAGLDRNDIEHFMRAIASEAGDDEITSRVRAAGSAVDAQEKGTKVSGFTALAEFTGKEMADAIRKLMPGGEEEGTANDGGRRVIRIVPGDLPRIVDEAETALIETACGLYQRGSEIVRTGWMKGKTAREKITQTHVVVSLDKTSMVEVMTKAARFQKWNASSKKYGPVNCPDNIAETYLSRIERSLPVLHGITDTPFLRYDGSLVEQPGYDERSGVLFEPNGVVFPPVPEQPTKDQAREALDKLVHLLREFPFVDGTDRSVALSTILTALDRRVMHRAPLHGITAPVAGSGKTLLAEIATMIATGQEPAAVTFSVDEIEFRKELTSILSGGQSCISIDNITHPLGGEFINSVLTSAVVQTRVLGHNNKIMRLATNVTLYANGNNLAFLGDFTRRALLCRLDPQMDHPETRNFSGRPIDEIEENRGELVIAALTALRAYHLAQPKLSLPAFNSFEDYNHRIIGPLVWLGEANPRDSSVEIIGDDPVRQELETMMLGWSKKHGDERVTTSQVIHGADADFFTTLREIAPDRQGGIDSKRLGMWLRRHRNRAVGYQKFIEAGTLDGFKLWQLKGASPKSEGQKTTDEPEIPF